MHIDSTSRTAPNGQVYTRHLLRTSYREDGKVKKETIANLSHCSDEEIVAMKLALRHKSNINDFCSLTDDVSIHQGSSFGATYVLKKVAENIGVADALGNSQEGKLALWQVLARVMDQGSRLSSVRLADQHNAASILDLKGFNEDKLYRNLDWISEQQALVEQSLIHHRGEQNEEYYLYDITSSYLEGVQNELANWGYNRDKKNGKMQIVVGLLCNAQGTPLSVEVFEGNTTDCTTVGEQMDKISKRWGCRTITLVGDKGMIQGPQIESIESAGHTFITTIAKAQIEKLIVAAGYQTTLIDEDLLEIVVDGYRYIMRRNPVQAEKTLYKREQLIRSIEIMMMLKNTYLTEHPNAKLNVAMQKVTDKIQKFKLGEILSVTIDDNSRQLLLAIDETKKNEAAKLDGCYAMKTNIGEGVLAKEEVQKKYKALSLVEDAFRCSKTEHLELRPIHVRLEKRTRGHVFVVMLSYLLIKELEKAWKSLDLTAQEGIDILKCYQTVDLAVKGKPMTRTVPVPNNTTKMLFDALDIAIPKNIPTSEEVVATRKK